MQASLRKFYLQVSARSLLNALRFFGTQQAVGVSCAMHFCAERGGDVRARAAGAYFAQYFREEMLLLQLVKPARPADPESAQPRDNFQGLARKLLRIDHVVNPRRGSHAGTLKSSKSPSATPIYAEGCNPVRR